MALQLAGHATPVVLGANKLHEAYMMTAVEPERPEVVRQQSRQPGTSSAEDGLKIVSGTHDEACSKLQDRCSIGD